MLEVESACGSKACESQDPYGAHMAEPLARRCLMVQPPSPEDKLAMLNDIAQGFYSTALRLTWLHPLHAGA